MQRHTLSVLVQDVPGVLTRVAGLFARRAFNIESLTVGPSEVEGLSRMTVVVEAHADALEQVTKQLNKLVNVIKIVELIRNSLPARPHPGQGSLRCIHPRIGSPSCRTLPRQRRRCIHRRRDSRSHRFSTETGSPVEVLEPWHSRTCAFRHHRSCPRR